MKNIKYIYLSLIVLVLSISFSCREEIPLETEAFESVLVVESTITNELKIQEVNLSRTYYLEATEQVLEDNANVYIEDNLQNVITFTQNADGIYVSNVEFQAEPARDYILHITTESGENYQSNATMLTPVAEISNLYPEVVNNETITIFLDADGTENNTQYYRYFWEETYKIIAPFYTEYDANIIDFEEINGDILYNIELTPREQEERICFTTNASVDIIQASSSELDSNIISRFPIISMDKNTSKLLERYSIIVTQITQNLESYSYYNTIKELGDTSSILSSNQPGYIQSNVYSVSNTKEKVLGFFDVASITKKRIYFDYVDLDLNQPGYFYECPVLAFDYLDNSTSADPTDLNERVELYQFLEFRNYKFVDKEGLTYSIVKPQCGDCTAFSSNIQPDFWID
ncbi:DUF4249 domain-containing protein [Lacinutrix algicola]|uniref:DUF4249 domain-containing protein n=1 Tax=Lacinutrix algicola TaxID=342954 RepID=UPI0006E12309|nr:DUF4249 domain-containing protein [Lacinutrix algicola]